MEPLSQVERKEDDGGARKPSSSPSGEADDYKELQKNRAASASDDEDDDDDDDDDGGTRQPYKCTFCRRGFPTAQALGGHMNVHRRHKGRSAAPTAGPSAAAAAPQGSTSCYAYEHYSTPTASTVPVLGFGHSNPRVSWTTTSMATPAGMQSEGPRPPPHELRLFGRPGKQGGGGAEDVSREHHRRYYPKEYRDDGDRGGGDAELDLELRLGGAGS